MIFSTIGLKYIIPNVPPYVSKKLIPVKLYGLFINVINAEIEILFNVSLFLYTTNAMHEVMKVFEEKALKRTEVAA